MAGDEVLGQHAQWSACQSRSHRRFAEGDDPMDGSHRLGALLPPRLQFAEHDLAQPARSDDLLDLRTAHSTPVRSLNGIGMTSTVRAPGNASEWPQPGTRADSTLRRRERRGIGMAEQ